VINAIRISGLESINTRPVNLRNIGGGGGATSPGIGFEKRIGGARNNNNN